jgi:predicted transcriptional regulator YdeE
MNTTLPRSLFLTVLAAVLSIGSLAQSPALTGASNLPTKQILADPIYVAGYQIRTSNAKELSGNGEIGKLWARFFQENLGAQIPNRLGQNLMVVYSDYASDEKGEYNYLLGVPVSSVDGLPAGISYRKIPTGQYAVITTEQGSVAAVMQAAWKRIWAMPPAQLGGQRAFLQDYEIYDQRASDPNNSQIEIHVGLRSGNDR